MSDAAYMRRALRLARRGEGSVSPNPMVGAVIVRDGRIIGEGYHRRFGGAHAEIEAIERAGVPVRGATIYITLEPCSHHGKTPPCTERLIREKPARVVVGVTDPNPLVSGQGIEALRRAGIATEAGLLEGACRELNESFFTFITTGSPFVTLKFAQTMDGRIASRTGDARWISSLTSRRFAHRLRSRHDAILVGIGTVLRDDPELTVRLVTGRNPLRIVVDSRLRLPLDAKVLTTQDQAKTIVATTRGADGAFCRRLEEGGIEVLRIDEDSRRRIDLPKLLAELGRKQIASLLVEGGAEITTSFLKQNLANRLIAIVAPKILGSGIDAVGDLGNRRIDESLQFAYRKVFRRGEDVIIDARPASPAPPPQP